jgi:hypothetical protein
MRSRRKEKYMQGDTDDMQRLPNNGIEISNSPLLAEFE